MQQDRGTRSGQANPYEKFIRASALAGFADYSIWRGIGSVKGDDPPCLFLPNVYFGKPPIIGNFLAVHGARALKASGHDSCVAVYANADVGTGIAMKFNAT